jgi:sugar/nucleoside kinase (ribokinase family)
MTCGAQGVLAVEPRRVLYEPGFSVDVADPVGSGDAFTAGFCSRYLAGADLEDALAFGNAAGAWVASQPGATGPMSARDLENLIGGQNRRNAAKRWQDLAQ